MTTKETHKIAAKIKAFTRELRKGHKKAQAKRMLLQAGIINKQGQLSKNYR